MAGLRLGSAPLAAATSPTSAWAIPPIGAIATEAKIAPSPARISTDRCCPSNPIARTMTTTQASIRTPTVGMIPTAVGTALMVVPKHIPDCHQNR